MAVYTFDCSRLSVGDVQLLIRAGHDHTIDAFLAVAEKCRTFATPVLDLPNDELESLLVAFMGALYLHLGKPLSEMQPVAQAGLQDTQAGDMLLLRVLGEGSQENGHGT